MQTFHTTTQHLLSRKSLNRLTTLFRHVVCCCPLLCEVCSRLKNVLTTNVVRQNISFVSSDVVCCSSRLTALQTWLSSGVSEVWQNVRRVLPLHTKTALNNMQQMVTKCCVLLGEKFGSFDQGFLGDLKESPSLGESSHVMFSRMAKYSSLTAFYTFSEQQPKAIEDKVCLHQS